MSVYLGDFAEDATLDFKWSTNDADGASITRGTNGTVSVYVGNSAAQLTTGLTDSEDFDSLTGVHHCRIDLSASATYAPGSECQVVLSAATIDGQTVNHVLAHFSIERAGGVLALLKAGSVVAASVTGNVGGNVTGSVGSLATQAKADVNAEADAAIETYHLDHLLAATYDPASKPGAADALLNELVESDGGVARFTENALEEAPTGGSAPTVGEITADIDANSTQLAAIKARTDNLPDDPADESEVLAAIAATDAKVDDVKAKTDDLTFTVAGKLDANITHVNEVEVTGDGEEGTEWGPA
jgi:hypothetical protein